MLGIVLFVVLLILSVLIHEAGHLLFAKRFGMKATEYFCGFGPKIFSFKRGETEYGLKAIPAGGYVKILGMSPQEELAPEDEPRAFWRQSIPKRAVVIAAGSGSHFLIAFVLLWIAASGLGGVEASRTIGQVLPCLETTCTESSDPSPAAAAGLEAGDEIVRIGGTNVQEWGTDSRDPLAATGTVPVTVLRDGDEVVVDVQLAPPAEGQRGRLGIVMEYQTVRSGVGEGAAMAAQQVGQFTIGSLQGLANLPGGLADTAAVTFGAGERELDDPVGVVGIARISGEITDVENVPTSAKVAVVLLLVAGANVFFGIFNLLPIPPLDGGHLAVMTAEGVRRRYARWRKRPDPGAIAPEVLNPVTAVVIVLFLGVTLLLLVADIFEPITLS